MLSLFPCLIQCPLLGGSQRLVACTQRCLPVGGLDIKLCENLQGVYLCAVALQQLRPLVFFGQAALEVSGGTYILDRMSIQLSFDPIDPANSRRLGAGRSAR